MKQQGNIPMKAKKYDTKKVLSKIFKYSKVFMVGLILSMVFAALAAILNSISPERIGNITNIVADEMKNMGNYEIGAMPNPDGSMVFLGFSFSTTAMKQIVNTAILLVVLYAVAFIFQVLQGVLMATTAMKLTRKMRSDIEVKINRLPLSYFDSRQTGDIMSIVTNDVETFSQSINNSVAQIASSVTSVLAIMVMMFVVAWQLALINIVLIPLAMVLSMITIKMSQKYFKANAKYTGIVTGDVEEDYTGHDIIKMYSAGNRQRKKFQENNDKLQKAGFMSQFLSGVLFPILIFISNLSYLSVAVVGALLNLPVGDIASMVNYSRRFSNPVVMIGQSLNQIQSALAAADRIFKFLEAEEMVDESLLAPLDKKLEGKVEFKNVKFGYTIDKEIIHNFSLKVNKGETIAIVGPTGAGKTTLVNLLMRFYEIDGGNILIDDINTKDIKREDVRSNFAMVLQDTWLFQGTIKENLVYNQEDVSNEELVDICKQCHVHHFIESLPNGYDTFLMDDSGVSNGQRQLLTIARAMLKKSQILILDEATSNVDTRTEVMIQDAMNTLMKDKTSFIIAHRLSTIRNATKILVLNDGDIVEIGNHQELLDKNGFYAKLYNSQYEE
jgi:ATP-binding cassette subfamily B protein